MADKNKPKKSRELFVKSMVYTAAIIFLLLTGYFSAYYFFG